MAEIATKCQMSLKNVANYAGGDRNCADDHEEMAPEVVPEYDSSRGQMDREQFQKVGLCSMQPA